MFIGPGAVMRLKLLQERDVMSLLKELKRFDYVAGR